MSYVTSGLAVVILVIFMIQAGVFQLLRTEKPTVQIVDHPEQITSGPSTISGIDNEKLPFSFAAQSAIQDAKIPNVVHLDTLTGSFRRSSDGIFHVSAKTGAYDTKLELLDLSGNVRVVSASKFDASLETAHIAVREKTLTSDRPVAVVFDSGSTIIANAIKISDDGNHILFFNGVKAKFKAPAVKGDAQQ